MNEKSITQLPMDDKDLEFAKQIAKGLGYEDQVAYTSSSSLTGLFCLAKNQNYNRTGCIVKTKEFGFIFIQDLRDLQLHNLADSQDA